MIEDLEAEGLIRPLAIDPTRVEGALVIAHRDLGVARDLLASSSDWAFTVAYNAVLQAGRALMFAKGYRPEGSNQHVSVVRFGGEFLSPIRSSGSNGCGGSGTSRSMTVPGPYPNARQSMR